jgi:hypothetical protein
MEVFAAFGGFETFVPFDNPNVLAVGVVAVSHEGEDVAQRVAQAMFHQRLVIVVHLINGLAGFGLPLGPPFWLASILLLHGE